MMARKKVWLAALIVCLLAGAWWAWRSHQKPPVVPAEQRAQEAVVSAVEAVASADGAVKKGKKILRAIPGEVRTIEEKAMGDALSADLDALADRANDRVREWVRRHPAGDAVGSPDIGAGAVLAGGDGQD